MQRSNVSTGWLVAWAVAASAWAVACATTTTNECPTCLREKCADLWAVCQQNLDCTCMSDCLGRERVPGIDACLASCGIAERPPGFAPLEACVATACPDDEDECATPGDYRPPQALACDATSGALGDGPLPDCNIDAQLPFDPDGDVLQLESADGGVCVRIERESEGAGALANTTYRLLNIRVGPNGGVMELDSEQACWYSSHHNFRDVVHAWSGSYRYDLLLREDGHGGPRTYDLYVFEQGPIDTAACSAAVDGTSCIMGPIRLEPVVP